MKTRIILALCLVALCAAPVLAEESTAAESTAAETAAAETSEAAAPAPETESLFEYFAVEGGCSMGQIREAQAWCHQKASVASTGGRECYSRGIHYCNADGGGGYDFECAISCR